MHCTVRQIRNIEGKIGRVILESHYVIARFHRGDVLSDRFDGSRTLMAKNNGEGSFRVLAGEGVCVWKASASTI